MGAENGHRLGFIAWFENGFYSSLLPFLQALGRRLLAGLNRRRGDNGAVQPGLQGFERTQETQCYSLGGRLLLLEFVGTGRAGGRHQDESCNDQYCVESEFRL